VLTDTFHERYADRTLWINFTEADRRFLVQGYRIIAEQLFPPFNSDGQWNEENKAAWKSLDDKLSMELGREHLSQYWYSLPSGTQLYSADQICRNFICATPQNFDDVDEFMKQRVSFIELAFRERAARNAEKDKPKPRSALDELLDATSGFSSSSSLSRLPGDPETARRSRIATRQRLLDAAIVELNARFEQAKKPLNYHNGFVQISADALIETQLERPFWSLIAGGKWVNVDIDMKEAIDRRDTGGRDPGLYAAKALESAVKIISDDLGLTTGGEKGAHSYLDNLGSERGKHFIENWEKDALKSFFSNVRNPLGHGPGGQPMPKLSVPQESWAIEYAMSWIKSLLSRLKLDAVNTPDIRTP
jgi:hypothetical protein